MKKQTNEQNNKWMIEQAIQLSVPDKKEIKT